MDQYALRLELSAPNGLSRTVALAAFDVDGDVVFSSLDPDQFDHSLAVLAAARFAELPISPFSRIALRQLFEPDETAIPGHHSSRVDESVYRLITETIGNRREQAQRDRAVKKHFEVVLEDFTQTLLQGSIASVDVEEDQADAETWVPGDRLTGERDRILMFGGEPAMSGREVSDYLGVSRTTLATWRARGTLLSLPIGSDRKLFYPRWQFDPERPTRVVPGLERVIAGLGLRDPWGVADILVTPHPALDGEVPIRRLIATRGADAARIRDLIASEYLLEIEVAKKSVSNQIHVSQRPEGWGATRAGGKRSSIPIQPTQAAAERAAKDLARRTGGSEVITHGRDGKIRSSDTIGKPDPHPPIDREH